MISTATTTWPRPRIWSRWQRKRLDEPDNGDLLFLVGMMLYADGERSGPIGSSPRPPNWAVLKPPVAGTAAGRRPPPARGRAAPCREKAGTGQSERFDLCTQGDVATRLRASRRSASAPRVRCDAEVVQQPMRARVLRTMARGILASCGSAACGPLVVQLPQLVVHRMQSHERGTMAEPDHVQLPDHHQQHGQLPAQHQGQSQLPQRRRSLASDNPINTAPHAKTPNPKARITTANVPLGWAEPPVRNGRWGDDAGRPVDNQLAGSARSAGTTASLARHRLFGHTSEKLLGMPNRLFKLPVFQLHELRKSLCARP